MVTDDDETADRLTVKTVLAELGVPECSAVDRTIVKTVCTMVTKRAARLAAVGIAAALSKMGPEANGCSVGVDGSLFKKHPHFSQWVHKALKELGFDCELFSAEDGSGMGAAITANIMAQE